MSNFQVQGSKGILSSEISWSHALRSFRSSRSLLIKNKKSNNNTNTVQNNLLLNDLNVNADDESNSELYNLR